MTPRTSGIAGLIGESEWNAIVTDLGLSRRESDVLDLCFDDPAPEAAARALGISAHTVHTYRQRVLMKLRVRTLAQAIARVLALRHLPLRGHASAWPAARAAECAADRNRLGPMSNVIYHNRDSLASMPWPRMAIEAGVPDRRAFDACLARTGGFDRIHRDTALAHKLRVMATPTVIVNGWRLTSTPDSASLHTIIDSLLAGRDPFSRKRRWGLFWFSRPLPRFAIAALEADGRPSAARPTEFPDHARGRPGRQHSGHNGIPDRLERGREVAKCARLFDDAHAAQ